MQEDAKLHDHRTENFKSYTKSEKLNYIEYGSLEKLYLKIRSYSVKWFYDSE